MNFHAVIVCFVILNGNIRYFNFFSFFYYRWICIRDTWISICIFFFSSSLLFLFNTIHPTERVQISISKFPAHFRRTRPLYIHIDNFLSLYFFLTLFRFILKALKMAWIFILVMQVNWKQLFWNAHSLLYAVFSNYFVSF